MASEHSNRVRVSSPVLREAPEHASCGANVMPKTSQMERPTKASGFPTNAKAFTRIAVSIWQRTRAAAQGKFFAEIRSRKPLD